MNIIFIGSTPIPNGGANTNRMISLAKGVQNCSSKVKIIITLPSEHKISIRNIEFSGVVDKIPYEYSSKNLVIPSNKIYKVFYYALCIIRACHLVFKYNRLERIDAIVIFISNIYLFLPFFFISKVIKSKYFIEVNEFPLIQNKNTYFNSKLLRPCYNLFDGIFVISYKLREYFQNELKINSKVIHLPMTVDLDRFSSSNSTINFENWVTYVGDPTGNKDGVSILISAFSIIANEYPSYKLIIIGAPSKSNDVITILKSHAKSLHLEDKIVFTGHLSNEEVVKYLVKSKILALARPSNYQNEGGFPTKLGEYLASGRPVVLTDVGDISKYLIDRVSAFIAKPNNIESFAIKLKEALQNDKFSDFIGNNGKQIAITYFNFITQGRTIISTINSYY